jgi:oligopeptide/dipeptide ABC transporter ATP-binding protein
MIFQQPQTALNPVFQVDDQIAEVLNIHQDFGKEAGKKRAVDLLKMVGIPDAERRAESYPHELSGGMAQRVMIAMALACVPELLIADEPTTALDVTIQAQILDLMRDLRAKMGTSVILITHDLGVIAEMAERVAVMYAGEIVEQADVNSLFDQPLHPYTQGLIGSIPVLGKIKDRLDVIPGSVPNLVDLPPGCRFAPRCAAREKYACKICAEKRPDLIEATPSHLVRCWLYQNAEGHEAPLKLR